MNMVTNFVTSVDVFDMKKELCNGVGGFQSKEI